MIALRLRVAVEAGRGTCVKAVLTDGPPRNRALQTTLNRARAPTARLGLPLQRGTVCGDEAHPLAVRCATLRAVYGTFLVQSTYPGWLLRGRRAAAAALGRAEKRGNARNIYHLQL